MLLPFRHCQMCITSKQSMRGHHLCSCHLSTYSCYQEKKKKEKRNKIAYEKIPVIIKKSKNHKGTMWISRIRVIIHNKRNLIASHAVIRKWQNSSTHQVSLKYGSGGGSNVDENMLFYCYCFMFNIVPSLNLPPNTMK